MESVRLAWQQHQIHPPNKIQHCLSIFLNAGHQNLELQSSCKLMTDEYLYIFMMNCIGYYKYEKVHWLLIKKVVYCVFMYEATMGFLFLVILVGLAIIICETGSGLIFSPRGLSHCCGRLVDDIWDGISFKPAIFHCSISNMVARTCAHWPDTLFENYVVALIINI